MVAFFLLQLHYNIKHCRFLKKCNKNKHLRDTIKPRGFQSSGLLNSICDLLDDRLSLLFHEVKMQSDFHAVIGASLEEAQSDLNKIGIVQAPVEQLLSDLRSFCESVIEEAKDVDGEKYVNASRVAQISSWTETKRNELILLIEHKKGEIFAYNRALEAVSKKAPGHEG
jgi:hypothetical protein